jgi:hypothetical protein
MTLTSEDTGAASLEHAASVNIMPAARSAAITLEFFILNASYLLQIFTPISHIKEYYHRMPNWQHNNYNNMTNKL